MPKQVKQKRSTDVNEIAHQLVERATQEPERPQDARSVVSHYMAQIGSKGGKIGGKRSLETMTPEERSARAKKASEAAARKRTADRVERERARKRTERAKRK